VLLVKTTFVAMASLLVSGAIFAEGARTSPQRRRCTARWMLGKPEAEMRARA